MREIYGRCCHLRLLGLAKPACTLIKIWVCYVPQNSASKRCRVGHVHNRYQGSCPQHQTSFESPGYVRLGKEVQVIGISCIPVEVQAASPLRPSIKLKACTSCTGDLRFQTPPPFSSRLGAGCDSCQEEWQRWTANNDISRISSSTAELFYSSWVATNLRLFWSSAFPGLLVKVDVPDLRILCLQQQD